MSKAAHAFNATMAAQAGDHGLIALRNDLNDVLRRVALLESMIAKAFGGSEVAPESISDDDQANT